jgi:hypothetical protein
MNEKPPGSDFKRQDFLPLRALSYTIVVAQCCGASTALWVGHYPGWFENLWFGGALATLPGYFIGLAVQRSMSPNSLVVCRPLVRRMGMVSAILTLSSLVVPLGALGP